MDEKKYLRLKTHLESCLDKYGDTHLGVDWPKQESAQTSYRVMLEVVRHDEARKVSLLDFGCGASHLYEYIINHNFHNNIEYFGLDVSEKFVELSKKKFPSNTYYCLDILDYRGYLPTFDYIVINGVFTEKLDLSFDEMFAFLQAVVSKVFDQARVGIAFNVMSKQVDWEREDLFHLPFDTLADFLTKNISRNFIIRHDYGLYQYTTYVYK
jgi:cyclopropane fatty-acyl-phospholipid synthase-like methyltransferase